eukprot:ANDGO_07981.mRNA.1 variant
MSATTSSMSTTGASGSKIHVHSADLFLDLCNSADWTIRVPKAGESPVPRNPREQMMEVAAKAKKDARRKAMEEEDIHFRAQVQRAEREKSRKREAVFQDRYRRILEEETSFVQHVKEYLSMTERANGAKREQLYREWIEAVYLPIQAQISNRIDSTSVEEIEKRRRDMFAEFLHQTNTKEGLFRDIIMEHEYNPLRARDFTVKYSDPDDLTDPTRRVVVAKTAEERASSASKATGVSRRVKAPPPRSREVFDIRQWDRPEATPYGRYNLPVDETPSGPVRNKTSLSRVVFDHYDIPQGKDAVQKEWPKGKRVFADWVPGQKIQDSL